MIQHRRFLGAYERMSTILVGYVHLRAILGGLIPNQAILNLISL